MIVEKLSQFDNIILVTLVEFFENTLIKKYIKIRIILFKHSKLFFKVPTKFFKFHLILRLRLGLFSLYFSNFLSLAILS